MWKIIIVILELIGLQLALRLFTDNVNWSMLNYFTNLSNIAVLIYFAVSVIALLKNKEKVTVYPAVKGAVTMSITVTMLVAYFLLGGFNMGGSSSLTLILLHDVCPLMVLLDWILFDEKGLLTGKFPLQGVAAPLLYFVYAMIAANIGDGIGHGSSRYPYPFIDVDVLGLPKVLLIVIGLVAFFLALGFGFYRLDRFLHRREKR